MCPMESDYMPKRNGKVSHSNSLLNEHKQKLLSDSIYIA